MSVPQDDLDGRRDEQDQRAGPADPVEEIRCSGGEDLEGMHHPREVRRELGRHPQRRRQEHDRPGRDREPDEGPPST